VKPRERIPTLLPISALVLTLAIAGCGSSSPSSNSATASQTSPAATGQTGAGSTATGSTSARTSSASTTTVTASGAAGVVTGMVNDVSATLHASTHHPRVNQAWPIHFTVTRAGQPIKASVSYEYLFGGQVVARRSHYTFIGHFSDVFMWPSSAVGYPLTFRAVIAGEGVTINLDYPVQVTA
jgi:hypothetical protein